MASVHCCCLFMASVRYCCLFMASVRYCCLFMANVHYCCLFWQVCVTVVYFGKGALLLSILARVRYCCLFWQVCITVVSLWQVCVTVVSLWQVCVTVVSLWQMCITVVYFGKCALLLSILASVRYCCLFWQVCVTVVYFGKCVTVVSLWQVYVTEVSLWQVYVTEVSLWQVCIAVVSLWQVYVTEVSLWQVCVTVVYLWQVCVTVVSLWQVCVTVVSLCYPHFSMAVKPGQCTNVAPKSHAKKLNHFHTTCLRKLLNIRWQDKVPDIEVLRSAGSLSIHTILMKSQIRWAGYVVRMPDHRLPKHLLYGELQQGRRTQGGQRKRFKDTLKASLKAFSISPDTWEEAATDRLGWRSLTHKCAVNCEEKRTLVAEERRLTRNLRASAVDPGDNLPCPNCNRTFRARIGLTSHLRTHLPK